jgi:hypothetical protein
MPEIDKFKNKAAFRSADRATHTLIPQAEAKALTLAEESYNPDDPTQELKLARLVRIVGGAINLNAGDIQIGAVELKDAETEQRLTIGLDGDKGAIYVMSESLAKEATLNGIKTQTDKLHFTGENLKIVGQVTTDVETGLAKEAGGNLQAILEALNLIKANQSLSLEHTLLDAVDTDEDGDAVNVIAFNNTTIHIIASAVTDGATVKIQHSLDGVNYVDITTSAITEDGVTEIVIENRKYKYLKASVSSRVDGTYSVLLIAGV